MVFSQIDLEKLADKIVTVTTKNGSSFVCDILYQSADPSFMAFGWSTSEEVLFINKDTILSVSFSKEPD